VAEFWLRQSSRLEVGLKKITIFIAKRQPAQASRQRAEKSEAISGNRRKTPNLTEVILLSSPHIEFPLEAGGSRLQLEKPPNAGDAVLLPGWMQNDPALGSILVFSRASLGELHYIRSSAH
jgi:hypothetical protein